MQLRTGVMRHLYVIVTMEYVYCIILMIQGLFQGQKVNLKVKWLKIWFFKK